MPNVANGPAVPRLAATTILLRPGPEGLEVYLTRRHAKSSFMPDAYVFPGGAVDDDDRAVVAGGLVLSDSAASERRVLGVAAIRETLEEAGIAFVVRARTHEATSEREHAELRAALARGERFSELLDRLGLVADARELHYYSNWVTPEAERKRFDTHFFVAAAPAGQVALADAVEVHDGTWLRARDALAASARGEMLVPFPTQRHLERIAAHDDLASFIAHAAARVARAVRPVAREDGHVEFDAENW